MTIQNFLRCQILTYRMGLLHAALHLAMPHVHVYVCALLPFT